MKGAVVILVKNDVLMIHPYRKHRVKDERAIE